MSVILHNSSPCLGAAGLCSLNNDELSQFLPLKRETGMGGGVRTNKHKGRTQKLMTVRLNSLQCVPVMMNFPSVSVKTYNLCVQMHVVAERVQKKEFRKDLYNQRIL